MEHSMVNGIKDTEQWYSVEDVQTSLAVIMEIRYGEALLITGINFFPD